MKSPNILLIDAFSSTHIGNAALVDSALEQLKGVFSDANYTILAFDPVTIEELSGHKSIKTLWAEPFSGAKSGQIIKLLKGLREIIWAAINLLNYSIRKYLKLSIPIGLYTFSSDKRAAVQAYSDADIVISISGEALQDSLMGRVPFFLYGYWLAKIMGKQMVLFPQSIGPLNKRYGRIMIGFILRKCDFIFPRDQLSLEIVNQLNIPQEKVFLIPDVAINQKYISRDLARKLLHNEGFTFNNKPVVGIAISKWEGSDYEKYFPVIRELCEFIIKQYDGKIILFSPNMPYKNETSDYELSEKLYLSISNRECVVLLKKNYSPREFKGIQGELDLFITTRMHSSIMSTMIGTPTISIITQPKLYGYMQMINQENMAISVQDFTLKKAQDMVTTSINEKENIMKNLIESYNRVGKDSLKASIKVYDHYHKLHG